MADLAEQAVDHNATEIDVISRVVTASHERSQRRLEHLCQKHPEIVAEADAEFDGHITPSVCSVVHEPHVASRKNRRSHKVILREP